MEWHRDRQPDSLWAWQGAWPMGLAELVDRLLNSEPEQRPTADEVVQELGVLFPLASRDGKPLRSRARKAA